MIIKYKTLYELERTVYLVHYPNERFCRVIVMEDGGEMIKNEIIENKKWLVSAIFENIIHSERQREGVRICFTKRKLKLEMAKTNTQMNSYLELIKK